jgi:putative flippase GtrA
VVLPIFVEIFSIAPSISGAITILVCSIFSYFGHSRFSFRSGYPERKTPI